MTGKINVLRSLLNEKSEEEVYQLSTEVHGLYGRTPLPLGQQPVSFFLALEGGLPGEEIK